MRSERTSILVAIALVVSACTSSVDASQPTTTTTAAAQTTTSAPLAPVTTTTTTPPATTTTTLHVPLETPRKRLVLSGAGDVNLDPTFVRAFRTITYEEAWTGLYGAFQRDDLTVVNLECSPSDDRSRPWVKPWTFACDPDAFAPMFEAGVDVTNLANNHAMDFGFDAMLEGRELLRAEGLSPVGVGANANEAYEPFVRYINGWSVAVIGSGGVHPESGSWIATSDRAGMSHGDDTDSIAEAVRSAKEYADIVLVTAHWGEQGTTRPRSFERRQAEAWIDAGADGIFGHHQHVLQPLEWYKGRPIAWGLGNFVWQAWPSKSKQTAIAQFVFEPDGSIGACLIPVVIESGGHPVIQDPTAPVCAPGVAGTE